MSATNDRHAAIQRWIDAANRQPKLSPFERDTLGERMVASVEAWRGGRYPTYDEAEQAYGVRKYRARRRSRRSRARQIVTATPPNADPHVDNRTSVILFPGAHRMLKQWVSRLRKVGVHVNIEMLQHLAGEAFEAYGDGQPVSRPWAVQYMRRHPDMFPALPAVDITAANEGDNLDQQSSGAQNDHSLISSPTIASGESILDGQSHLSYVEAQSLPPVAHTQVLASTQAKPCGPIYNERHESGDKPLCPCKAVSSGVVIPARKHSTDELSETILSANMVEDLFPKERAAACQRLMMIALAGYM